MLGGSKSYREVELSNLGKTVLLVGRNSAGKTNLLELLEMFFRDLDGLPNKNLGAVNEHIWFNFNVNEPIEVEVELEVEPSILTKALPPEFPPLSGDRVTVRIHRSIVATGGNMGWQTNELKLGELSLVSSGKPVEPSNVAGAPAPKSVPGAPVQSKPPADLVQRGLQGVSQALLGRFQLIYAARDRQLLTQPSLLRQPLLDDQTLASVQTVAQLTNPAQRARQFVPLERSLRQVIPLAETLSAPSGQAFVQETNGLSMPLAFTGGGVQEVINLLVRVQSLRSTRDPCVIGVEEPENHLHPESMKLLLKHFREDALLPQLWLSTHSPFFLDRAKSGDVWFIRRDRGESIAQGIAAPGGLGKVVADLGIRPSDLLYSDAILLVEGPSDREFYTRIAPKLGFTRLDLVAIVPTGGFPQERHHLEMWTEIGQTAGLPLFLILDGDAQSEVSALIRDKRIERRRAATLAKGSLEDQYPPEKLSAALHELWGLDIPVERLPETGRAPAIQKALYEHGSMPVSWKEKLAARMGDLVEGSEAPQAFANLVNTIRVELDERYGLAS